MTVVDLRSGKPCKPPTPPQPLAWIEPAMAPNIPVSLPPRVDVHGPLSIVQWALAERSVHETERHIVSAVVSAKLTMPTETLARGRGGADRGGG